jgi:hypothetical protein
VGTGRKEQSQDPHGWWPEGFSLPFALTMSGMTTAVLVMGKVGISMEVSLSP